MDFPLVNTQCPSLIDTLIGIEECGCLPISYLGENYFELVKTPDCYEIPDWVIRGVENNYDGLLAQVKRLPREAVDKFLGIAKSSHEKSQDQTGGPDPAVGGMSSFMAAIKALLESKFKNE